MTRRRAKKADPSSKPGRVPDLPAPLPSLEEQSQVTGGAVSRYIGETEKRLARSFSEAQPSSASLLFTEGDSLLN